jgi:uncharacterized protein YutE (UPF0331/DUF86 family)
MIDKDLIEAKFDIIETNLKFLEEFKDKSIEYLESSYRDLQAIKYSLLEICEACIDVANHIISAKRLERVEEYSKMFEVLAKNRIIPKKLGEKLAKMAKFRNLLIHRYAYVKTENLMEIIRSNLVDVVEFMREIEKFLEKKG